MAHKRKQSRNTNAKPVASRKKPMKRQKAKPRARVMPRKAAKAVKSRKPIPRKAAKRLAEKQKPLKKQVITVVSTVKTVSPEHKAEMEHLHRILSDAYVRQMLIEVGGENALEIVRHFYGSHSDEELAKSLSLRISDVRATLNRLHSKGLVQYAREKDSETGWYSYSWSLNRERIVKWVSETAGKSMASTNEEGNQYYFCPTCGLGSVVDFASASDHEFRCSKCNKSLEFMEEERFSTINSALRKS